MNWKKIIRVLIMVNGYMLLGAGLYVGILYITGGLLLFIDFVVGIIIPMFAAYAIIIYPIITIVMFRLHNRKSKFRFLPLILGTLVVSFMLLPFVGIPHTVTKGNQQFEMVFGTDYMDKIPEPLQAQFNSKPFDLWNLYNFHDDFACNVTKDCGPYLTVPGYNDEFYFDYYCPKSGDGPFPTIINIHGGAWILGNKGTGNNPQFSRHLAQQGYAVFDIQYGLYKFPDGSFMAKVMGWIQSALDREILNKSYIIPEMAIQILGNFTDYLVAHATEYKVNLSSVYVMGRSAGAHLSGLFLGYNSTYKHIFNDSVKLKGLILFYCPANMTTMYLQATGVPTFGSFFEPIVGGTPEKNASLFRDISPLHLVDASAPPCLILHGQFDLLPFSEALALKAELEKHGRPAILISFPFQGHAFDLSFNSPGGQVSIYYVERFLAATQYIEV